MTLESDAKFEKKLSRGLENNIKILAPKFKIGTFMGYLYQKYKMYEFKIHKGLMCYDNKERCKI